MFLCPAREAYQTLFSILGDTDTAAESAQLLAQLARNEEDVATWGDIAAGVMGTFGDALPINSLIEASNETAKVGEVTGALEACHGVVQLRLSPVGLHERGVVLFEDVAGVLVGRGQGVGDEGGTLRSIRISCSRPFSPPL